MCRRQLRLWRSLGCGSVPDSVEPGGGRQMRAGVECYPRNGELPALRLLSGIEPGG
jgi:hypothetical protein